MKQKKPVSALRQVTWTALWRRKGVCILLSAIAALGVFSSMALQNLATRQEAAMEKMVQTTQIHCVVLICSWGDATSVDVIWTNM